MSERDVDALADIASRVPSLSSGMDVHPGTRTLERYVGVTTLVWRAHFTLDALDLTS